MILCGYHRITLAATDSDGAAGSDSVSIMEFAPVKIGEIHPFTGPLAAFGEPEHNAALLAVKHLEEAGYTIETVSADSESDAVAGVEAAQTLVEDEDVQVFVGAASSDVTISIAESVSIPGQIPQISYASTSPLISELPADEAQVAGEELTSTAIRDHLCSVSGPPGEEVFAGSEGLTQALEPLREGNEIDYVGASGDVDFDENGDVLSPIEVWCYQGGEIVSQGMVQP